VLFPPHAASTAGPRRARKRVMGQMCQIVSSYAHFCLRAPGALAMLCP
jgi:hypothetical protein